MSSQYVAIHQNPQGPGDARPTALQIIKDADLGSKLQDKVILITGCSSGIGVETAKALHTTGAILYLTARNLNKAKESLGDLITSPRVHLLELDLESLASVRACAKQFLSQSSKLNIFIANAGVMACAEGRTKDGFETQFGTNHLSHFLLFNLLKCTLLLSTTPEFASRAIILTSVGHRIAEPDFNNLNLEGKYDPWLAYGSSKTANLWTSNEIERRYGSKGLHSWGIQPGGVTSNLSRHIPEEQAAVMFQDPFLSKMMKNVEQGAATSVWAAVSTDLEGQGGQYLDDCQIMGKAREGAGMFENGTGPWAFDEKKEGKLWKKSLELVGLEDDL